MNEQWKMHFHVHYQKRRHLNKGQINILTTSAYKIQGKYISVKLTSQSKPLFASFNPWFSFTLSQKMKIKGKFNSRIVFFFHYHSKFMDERTTTCI